MSSSDPVESDYLSLREAASLLGVSSSVLRRQVSAGRVSGRRTPGAFGVRWEVESNALQRLMANERFDPAMGEAPEQVPMHYLYLVLGLALSLLILAWLSLAPATPPSRFSDLDVCKRNLRELGLALNRYGGVHHGRYPRKLSELVPDHLSRLPHCPEVGMDTYSAGYTVSADRQSYRLECAGHHHGAIVPSLGHVHYHG